MTSAFGVDNSAEPSADATPWRMLRHRLGRQPSTPIVALMVIIACLGYAQVFAGWGFLVQIVVATLAATACAAYTRRQGLLLGEGILVTVLAFFVVGIVVTQWVPSLMSPADFAAAVTNGWADLLSSQTPASMNSRRAVVPFTTAWVAATLAHELDRRVRFPAAPLIGVLVGLVATSLFSVEARSLARMQGPLLIALTIVLGLISQYEGERTGLSIANSTTGVRRRIVTPAATLLLVTVLAAVVGPRLPLADANERFDLRDLQENPWDPLDAPSPLVNLKASLKLEDDPSALDSVAFRVTSDTPISRWTVAVMATYDGLVWQVADPDFDTAAQFVPVDERLPVPERNREAPLVDASVEIVGLDGPWLPHGGDPHVIVFDDADLRLNLATRTVALPVGLRSGDRYELTTRQHGQIVDLASATFDADDRSIELQRVPAPVLNLAASLVEGQDFGGPQVAAIRDLLTQQGFYDAGPSAPPGHSYGRLAQFIDDPGRIVGYEEHYAATAGVLARIASIPARVAVGYVIEPERYVDGTAEVRAADATAWIEVDVRGVGWVPVDVTPDRSREPTEQEIGRVTRNVAVPNDPPPPPPPQQSDDDDELVEDEEDEDEEDEELADDGGSLLTALLDRPGLVAGTVAVSPFIGFGLLALLTLALKAWRRRRRRHAESPRLQVAGAWAELVDRFEEAGYAIERNATPTEIVEQIGSDPDVEVAESDLRMLAGLVSASAFAADVPTTADVDAAWNHADEAADAAAGSLDLLERTRMRIDPRPLLRRGPREVAPRTDDIQDGDSDA